MSPEPYEVPVVRALSELEDSFKESKAIFARSMDLKNLQMPSQLSA